MSKEVAIIGGGVIGLFSAYYLSKSGHKIVVLDKGDMLDNCSNGNAGMIVPSHVVPLAQPGMISQGIKWMFNSKSPFYVKPRFNAELLSWGRKFYQAANQKHVEAAMPALLDISLLSKKLYQDLSSQVNDFNYEEKGLLMLFQSEKVGEEERHVGQMAENLGIEVDYLNQDEVQKLESGVQLNAIGGVHFKSDAHLYPSKLIAFLKTELTAMNVEFLPNIDVLDIEIEGGKVSQLITNKGEIKADEFVIATGAWSAKLAKLADEKLSILPGKGYSFTLNSPELSPSIPSILCEGKVAVTPMGSDLRFGGTMEITHVKDNSINMNRVQGIVDTINSFYPDLNIGLPSKKDVWKGFRPCSPTGLPYICRSKKHSNLVYATGHGMMGLSLGPATGKLVDEILNVKKSSIELSPFLLK
ncbi:MAG: D-amino-acid dehydrogenase [Crocinitomicaceae bacterium]|jgi:D-amino-acid dehydrogenase